jgi:hypothetical protein
VKFRIFKENSLNCDERNVATLQDAESIYDRYFADGYSVRIVEIDTGAEFAMRDGKLIPIPYRRHGIEIRRTKSVVLPIRSAC